MAAPIGVEQAKLAEFCRRNRIRRLSLFGSALTESFRPDSDLDFLVEFEPDARVSLMDMSRMERELSALVGRDVDFRTARELSRHFRDRVLAEAQVQYASG